MVYRLQQNNTIMDYRDNKSVAPRKQYHNPYGNRHHERTSPLGLVFLVAMISTLVGVTALLYT